MILRILVLSSGGLLLYSKNFLSDQRENEDFILDDDLIGGFLSAISSFAIEIKGGEIKALNFRNSNFIYSYDTQFGCMFVLITEIDDLEEEAREKVELMKNEFIKRYSSYLEDFSGMVSVFDDFGVFIEEYIFIPPKILLVGENGVGKTTIMDLFPGETILELDEDLNEIIQKLIGISGIGNLKQFLLREFDLEELINNSKLYRKLINSIDIICVVTNSAASNLSRTKSLLSRLELMVKKADLYIIANFQDLKDTSFEPIKIEDSFGIKTYGFSATQKGSKKKIFSIFTEILSTSILNKMKKKEGQESLE